MNEIRYHARFGKVALAMLLLGLMTVMTLTVWAGQPKKVKVGFFAFDGYHEIDRHGRRSGYGYDYLQYLARYTDFEYEYVGYDKSWSEMQDMLEHGEIDILTSAQKTAERMARFDFSDYPIGDSAAILTVKSGDSRYMVDDYAQLDGIRIGLLQDNSRNQDLELFAQENNFTYEPVPYDSISSLTAALQEGREIDAVMTSNLREIENEWIVAAFDTRPFYIMVRKGNQQLLDEINSAVTKLQMDNQDLTTVLFKRYYTADNGDEISYTAEERAYIKAFRESGQKLKVTFNSDREPVSYFVDGDARGIVPEISKEILRRTGLPYEVLDTPPTVDAWKLLTQGGSTVRFDGVSDFNEAEMAGLRVTDPYLELPFSCVTRRDLDGSPETVAVIQNSGVVDEYVEQVYDDDAITRYSSAAQCLDAVLKGRQDAAVFQTYIAQRFVYGDVQNRLKEQLIPGYSMNFAVSMKTDDPLLFSILDKSALNMNEEEINRIIREQTSYISGDVSLLGYLYAHPVFCLLLLAVAASFIIILILYVSRRKNFRLERDKNREFERFISYVCRANNNVLEIEPASGICRSYQVEEGKVLCRELPLGTDVLHLEDIHPDHQESMGRLTVEEALGQLIETGGEKYIECRVRHEGDPRQGDLWQGDPRQGAPRQGEPRQYQWFSYTFQGIPRDDAGAGRLMVFIKNINQAKQEEEKKRQVLQDALIGAQQSGDARASFMSRMSHEIRTPLNAIIGYLSIAGSSLDHPVKTGECLDKAGYAAHQLLNLINDVLDFSAIESGKMKIAHEEFNIRQLLSGITSMFRTQAMEKGVEFCVRLDGLTEENLIGDQLRLNQVLMNLLSNAVKFTPEDGEVTLTVFQKAVVDKSIYLQFEIADTGIGMSEDYKKRLFQPFEQQDASTARRFGGTGLGLSITRNLISMMNGTIEVQSEEGSGTLFTVNLFFDMSDTSRQDVVQSGSFSHLRVLALYDGNEDNGHIRTLLDCLGVTYDIVQDQEEALRKVEERMGRGEHYDLCLLDWDNQDIRGREAAERIRDASAPYSPMLLAIDYEASALEEGDDLIEDIIWKPVFKSSLSDAFSGYCRRYGPRHKPAPVHGGYGLEGSHILLAEDNVLNMDIAREILSSYGIMIDAAVNGQEAAERFEQSKEGTYQAILMDIQMPVLDGYGAAERIRRCCHPQAKTIPIIALSADAFAEDINRALAVGMNSHVSKPVDFGQLCRVLTDLISGSGVHEAGACRSEA